MLPTPETLDVFVQFVRLNPLVPSNSPVIMNAFRAYLDLQAQDLAEQLRERGYDHLANLAESARLDGQVER